MTSNISPTIQIIRPGELAEILNLSTVTIWRMEKRGDLPPRKKIGKRSTGWTQKQIEDWLESRPNAYSDLPGGTDE
jgi:prophage regulatory protein